jgi:hypothetical protein
MISQIFPFVCALGLVLLVALSVAASKRDVFPGRRQGGGSQSTIEAIPLRGHYMNADVIAFDIDADSTIMGASKIKP